MEPEGKDHKNYPHEWKRDETTYFCKKCGALGYRRTVIGSRRKRTSAICLYLDQKLAARNLTP